MIDQWNDVVAPLGQRWHVDCDHLQAMIQVLAKLTVFNEGFQISIGGAEDAHVHLNRRVLAHACDLATFQHTQ